MKIKMIYKILLLAVLFILPVFYVEAAVSVGKITVVEGQVDILKEGKLPAVAAKAGDVISVKDIIRTKSASKAEIVFNDGNVLRIAQRSRIDINEYTADGQSKASLNLPRGKVEANVDKRITARIAESPTANKFEIRTPVAVAGVRGTKYFTFHERGVTGILVKEGKVETFNPKFPTVRVLVGAGQITTVSENKPPQAPRPATDAEKRGHEKDVAPSEKPKDKAEDKPKDNDKPKDTAKANDKPADNKPSDDKPADKPKEIAKAEGQPKLDQPAPPPVPPPVFVDPMLIAAPPAPAPTTVTYVPPPPITETTTTTTTTTTTDTDKFISDMRTNNLSGTLKTESSIWNATSSNQASIKLSGDIVTRRGMLDIHAADEGTTGDGQWTTLLPGSVTHTDEPLNENYIVDSNHPVTSYLTDSDYSGWNYVSHGYFTNLYSGTNTILRDADNKPTTIEYTYSNTNVLATMQTLEWTSLTQPLKNTLAYTLRKAGIMPGYGKLLLLQDNAPWWTTANQDILDAWGISYDIKTSAEFTSLSLSPYSAIVIASDQNDTFYANMADNVSKLGSFTAPTYTPTFISEIYSSNKSNSDKTTYDGGAYRGYIMGTELSNALDVRMYALYVDPDGNAGILKGSFSGTTGSTTWSTEGSMYPIKIVSDSDIDVTPQNLYSRWHSGGIDYRYDSLGSGDFDAGGSNYINYILIEGANLLNNGTDEKWGIWNSTISGTYTGATSNGWNFTLPPTTFEFETSSSFMIGSETTGTKWLDNKLEGSIRGYWVDLGETGTPETGIFVGETLGTFEPNKWQAVQAGAWMETNKLLAMACPSGACNTTGSNLTTAQQALKNLNIPVVEVGRANFSGSGNNLTVNMNDVIFLATQSGQKATMWATGNVSGSYTADPTLGTAVTLTGSSGFTGSVDFTPERWDTYNNKWMSTISGSGDLSGGSYTGTVIMKGAGAGTINQTNSTFSGTAAGTAK